jgi:hypothetical protein
LASSRGLDGQQPWEAPIHLTAEHCFVYRRSLSLGSYVPGTDTAFILEEQASSKIPNCTSNTKKPERFVRCFDGAKL